MSRYRVYGLVEASVCLGEYEAESKGEAIEKAEQDKGANWNPSVCHQCSRELDIGDVYEVQAEKFED